MDELQTVDRHDRRASRARRRRSSQPRRKRWIGLALVFGLVAILPNLIGWTGLHQPAVDYLAADFEGSVTIDSLSCGWFQPVELRGVSAIDRDGEPLFSIDAITTTETLVSLIRGTDYGVVNVERPQLRLQLRRDGSNLEDALANYLNMSGEDAPLPRVQFNVHDGAIELTSTGHRTGWHLHQLQAAVRTGASEAPLLIELESELAADAIDAAGQPIQHTGRLSIAGQVDTGEPTLKLATADLRVETSTLPVSIVAPLAERFVGPVELAGQMTSQAQVYFSAPAQSLSVNFDRLDGRQLTLSAPELIGNDTLQLQSVGAQGSLQLTPRMIAAREFAVNSNLGQVQVDGTLDLEQLTNLTEEMRLFETPFQLDGKVDLAALIKMLPSTLQLHRDLDVRSGTVTFQINSRVESTRRRLVFNVDTANLQARRGNRDIVWAQPLRLVGTVTDQNGQLQIENINCDSEFFQLQGNGTTETASFTAAGNLDTLTQRIAQFVDLQGMKLAGRFEGEFGWQASADARPGDSPLTALPLVIGGTFTVDQPVVELPDWARWQSESLQLQLSGSGMARRKETRMLDDGTDAPAGMNYVVQIDQGQFQLDVGTERATVNLIEPINDLLTQSRWHARAQVTGKLEKWLSHLRNFVDVGDLQGRGDLELVTSLVASPSAIRLNGIQYRIQPASIQWYAMNFNDTQVHGEGAGQIDLNNGSVLFSDLTMLSTAASARARNLTVAYPENLQLDGDVAFRANVNRAAEWFELSPTPESLFWFGDAEGTVHFDPDQQGIAMQIDATIRDLVAARQTDFASPVASGGIVPVTNPQRQWTSLWEESRVRLAGGLTIGNDYESLALRSATVESTGMNATVDGTLNQLFTTLTSDLRGTFQPDWSRINGLIADYAGDLVRLQGNEEYSFQVRGPLFGPVQSSRASIVAQPAPWVPQELQASAQIGWESGQIANLPVGASQFDVLLEDGLASVKTDGIPFAGGELQFAPVVDLRTAQPVLTLGRTRLIDSVELKSETARQWLRYVAPLAADATSAQGTFTIDIGEASIPLLHPEQAEVRGAVRMSQVVLGAGPLAEQLISTVKQVRRLLKPGAPEQDLHTWLRVNEQTIPVAIRDGRVFHDQVKFSHKELQIRTRGSVGFDQSLQLIAEIPIADDWIDGQEYLAGLKGQFLTIPISGTIAQPKLNTSALEQLSKSLVEQATRGAIDKAIDQQVNPKLNELQQKFNNKLNDQWNKLQQDLNDKLRIGSDPSSLFPGLTPPNSESGESTDGQPSRSPLSGFGDLFRGQDR